MTENTVAQTSEQKPSKSTGTARTTSRRPKAKKEAGPMIALLYNHKTKKTECRVVDDISEICADLGAENLHFTEAVLLDADMQQRAIDKSVQYVCTLITECNVVRPRPVIQRWEM